LSQMSQIKPPVWQCTKQVVFVFLTLAAKDT